jgi:hypothetical protein
MLNFQVNNIRNFIFGQLQDLVEKITYNVHFKISQFSEKKEPLLFKLLATTLSPLGLIFFSTILALLAIYFFV